MFIAEFQITDVKEKKEIKKSPLGKHHSKNYSRQDPLTGANMRGYAFEERQK